MVRNTVRVQSTKPGKRELEGGGFMSHDPFVEP